ncbi:tRNA-intron endonuclease catalytic domain-like protein [Clavulina sp. PMI_390]|nr:tRNA-intron endonuclease catalytic domain-like protein [Clavulina sp. PMI_390]
MVTVPAASTSLPWYPSSLADSSFALKSPITASLLRNSQLSHEHTTLASARNAGIWSYPSTQAERAKCAVFRDLHRQGYWMGGGLKFGGDWLVYPGDSLRYHSHFVATVFPTPTSSLRPMEIVALGRLGTATKKSHLLCGWDETTGKVDYYSIEWAGFG